MCVLHGCGDSIDCHRYLQLFVSVDRPLWVKFKTIVSFSDLIYVIRQDILPLFNALHRAGYEINLELLLEETVLQSFSFYYNLF